MYDTVNGVTLKGHLESSIGETTRLILKTCYSFKQPPEIIHFIQCINQLHSIPLAFPYLSIPLENANHSIKEPSKNSVSLVALVGKVVRISKIFQKHSMKFRLLLFQLPGSRLVSHLCALFVFTEGHNLRILGRISVNVSASCLARRKAQNWWLAPHLLQAVHHSLFERLGSSIVGLNVVAQVKLTGSVDYTLQSA